ncbi:MAG: cobalamin B12-binding domain-containing protein [Acidobacteria bacterium]|nr:cobalamin B12-binding domain-containing protein [Acidobacteriota bacterium]
MRILLVDPPMQSIMLARADWFPMGLAYLAGSALRENHEVIVYNGEHDPKLDYVNLTTYSSNYYRYLDALSDPGHAAWKRIATLMADFRPDLLGITSFTVKIPSAKRIAALGKDYNPRMPVVLGGQHATIMTEEVLSDPNIDFVVRGEGEQTFIELLRQMEGEKDWTKIDGLSYKDHGRVVHNKPRALLTELDSFAMPARQCLFEVDKYESQALGKLFASRGCPYQCTYCGTQNVWTYKLRHHSAERVMEEIRKVKKEFGTTYFTFFDDVFGIDRRKALELTRKMAEAKLNISWDCLTRANLVSAELLSAMKAAGCTKIDMGVESGSEKVLKDTKKGVTKDQIRVGAALVKKHKILLYMFFMTGLPTETEEDAKQTREFLKELKPDWAGISIFTPIPGTELYKELRAKGHIPDQPDYARFSHQSPHSNFAFSMLNREAFPALAKETIEYIQAYNGSYRNLFRRGLSRGYHRNPRLLLSDIRKVATWKGFLQASHQGSHSRFYTKPMLERE